MDVENYVLDHIPEIILILGSIIALLVVYTYRKNELSGKYKGMLALGVIFGAVMIVLTVSSYASWNIFTAVIIAIMGFALVIRPFREVHFAIIIALMVMVVVYVMLGGTADIEGLEALSEGWPRVIVAFVVGALVYMVANFAEKLIMLFGKLFNWWPFLALLAVICLVEAVCLLAGYGSVYDLITNYQG